MLLKKIVSRSQSFYISNLNNYIIGIRHDYSNNKTINSKSNIKICWLFGVILLYLIFEGQIRLQKVKCAIVSKTAKIAKKYIENRLLNSGIAYFLAGMLPNKSKPEF